MSERLSLGRARSLWWERQGLGDDAKAEDVARAIGVTGWLRTRGGADVYVAARARCPGLTRAELDAAVSAGDLRVIPAVRGCSYLVPARFVADLMALHAAAWRAETEQELARANAKFAIVESTAQAILGILAQPLTTDGIRAALPELPSFGAALSSPVPLALRMLELAGTVERTLEGGRLDSDRYLWRESRFEVPPAATTEAARLANVVRAFLDFAGPSTLAHIASWTGRAPRDLEPVLEAIGAEPVTIDGLGPAFAQPGDIDCAHEAMLPLGLRLLASEDNYLVNHGGSAVTDPQHHAIEAAIRGDGAASLSRTIVIDGLVAGFWEIDPRAHAAVWMTFAPQQAAVVAKLETQIDEIARFLLDDVGNCRGFAADTLEHVQARADRIRAMAKSTPTGPATKKQRAA